MHAPAVGRERAGSDQQSFGGTDIYSESTPLAQASNAPLPLRSRGPVPIFSLVSLANRELVP